MKVKKLIFHLFMSILLIVSVSACGSSSDLENKAVKENKKKEDEASNEAKPEKLIIWEEEGKAEALKPVNMESKLSMKSLKWLPGCMNDFVEMGQSEMERHRMS
jgi:maltose-binding protein MalE